MLILIESGHQILHLLLGDILLVTQLELVHAVDKYRAQGAVDDIVG